MRSMQDILQQIQSYGERLTIQRRLVIEALCGHTGHQSIGELRQGILKKGHDLPEPTIYRILQWLKDLELISQTDMGEAGMVYELVSSPPHHHLICLKCGRVVEVQDRIFNSLREAIQQQHHFTPRIEHMAIYGYCAACAALD